MRTVTELALRHRYVLLDLPGGGEELYVVTCFSDRDKVLSHVEKEA